MQIISHPMSTIYSTRAAIGPHYLSGMPASACFDRGNSFGGGNGTIRQSITGGVYEFIERRGFSGLQPSRASRLDTCGRPDLASSLKFALRQMAEDAVKDKIETHEFTLIDAIHLSSGQAIHLPFSFVTLGSNPDNDVPFTPYSDSSGSACHSDPSECQDRSLLEFIERQCLVASWLGAKANSACKAEAIRGGRLAAKTAAVLDNLTAGGEVWLVDISADFTPSVILALYKSKNSPEGVHYAAGAASYWNRKAAIEKSILELWQAYCLMARLVPVQDSSGLNRLARHYIDANDPNTVDQFLQKMSVFSKDCDDVIELNSPSSSRRALLNEIVTISDNTCYFSSSIELAGEIFCIGKTVNPDFFLHMDVTGHLNAENKFTKNLGLNPEDFDQTPLPFG